MKRTIIKTGCVLQCKPGTFDIYDSTLPPMGRWEDNTLTIYGDLHVVGKCCILYMPIKQIDGWPRVHGLIGFEGRYFWRGYTKPYGTLVIESRHIELHVGALHELDWAEFIEAGGQPYDVSRSDHR